MNSIGHNFRITLYGESHGQFIGIVIDGCPPGIAIDEVEIAEELLRRRSWHKATTPRIEEDAFNILSGVYNGKSTGAPINIQIENTKANSKEYKDFTAKPRPGHADFTARTKYKGFNDPRGGGMFSGRLTAPIVAAGAIAKKVLEPANIHAEIDLIGGSKDFEAVLQKAIEEGDSAGGVIKCTISDIPIGLGEPFFDSIESAVSRMIFSIPGIKGIEFGLGFQAAALKGSEYNDAIIDKLGATSTNNSGGINGGISNGNEIIFRVAVRPSSSIAKAQQTYDFSTNKVEEFKIKGRHDVCFALRLPVIIEAVTAITFADLLLTSKLY